MTPAEAGVVLARAAGYDNRKPDPVAAEAWSKAFTRAKLDSHPDVLDAVDNHYATSTDWLKPAHVIEYVKRIRAKRLAEAPPLLPPVELDDDPAAANAWIAAARRHIADGGPAPVRGEITRPRDMSSLRALTARKEP